MRRPVVLASVALVFGLATTSLAGLWERAELEHAKNVKVDREKRLLQNERDLERTKDADLRRVIEAKIAYLKHSLELQGQLEAAIAAGDLVKTKGLREALHLRRQQIDTLNLAGEDYVSVIAYKLAQKEAREAVSPTLGEAGRTLESNAKALDPLVERLVR